MKSSNEGRILHITKGKTRIYLLASISQMAAHGLRIAGCILIYKKLSFHLILVLPSFRAQTSDKIWQQNYNHCGNIRSKKEF